MEIKLSDLCFGNILSVNFVLLLRSVAKFVKKSERKEAYFTNVYVKNLDLDFTENELKEKFSEYGNVTSAVIMKDADGGSRGFGFVNFESADAAKKAIQALNGAVVGKKIIKTSSFLVFTEYVGV